MEQTAKIVMFSTPTCSFCKQAKNYFIQNKLKFKEIDVSRDPAAMRDMQSKTGGNSGVPVILINNRPIIGFDKTKINSLLNLKN